MAEEPLPYDEWAQDVYLAEILLQCGMVLRARDQIVTQVRGQWGQPPDHLGLALAYQAFLGAAACVSRYVEPSPVRANAYRIERGRALRRRLEISDSSPILSREVRDGLEHMDERLDHWLALQPRPSADDLEAGNLPTPPTVPVPVRLIDGPGLRISFLDDVVDVEAVADEARRIVGLIPGDTAGAPLLTLLRRLAPLPPELRLDAPTRRPDEPVTAGIELDEASVPTDPD